MLQMSDFRIAHRFEYRVRMGQRLNLLVPHCDGITFFTTIPIFEGKTSQITQLFLAFGGAPARRRCSPINWRNIDVLAAPAGSLNL